MLIIQFENKHSEFEKIDLFENNVAKTGEFA